MAGESLLQTLHRLLNGEAVLDELLDGIDDAQGRSPDLLTPLQSEIEILYSRGALDAETYLTLKRRLDPATRARPPKSKDQPIPQPGNPTVQRPPVSAGDGGVPTDLRPSADSRPDSRQPIPGREPRLEVGSIIIERFVLEERLGAGGMGVVFKARDMYREDAQDSDPYVAIKFVNAEFRKHPISLMALEREARKHMRLAHPNILTVHDFKRSPDSQLIFLHMELLKGEPLDRLIQRHPQGLAVKDALPLIEGVGRALMYAHEMRIIHSDLKPGNIFAVESAKAKVLDFGIAREVSAGALGNREGTRYDAGILGAMTPEYASPEMLLGDPPSPSDDIYALACVTYELVSGRHPFGGVSAIKAAHEGLKIKRTPGMLRYHYKAIARGLQFKKADRTPSVQAFLEEFRGPLDDKKKSKRKALRAASATAALLGALVLAVLWYLRPGPDEILVKRLEERGCASRDGSNRQNGRLAEKDPEMIKALLDQGGFLLEQARNPFDAGLLSANQVSSAYGAFCYVLSMDPNNRDAITGIVEIVHEYEAEMSRRSDAGDYVVVSELAGYARTIDPDRESLEDIERNAQDQLKSASE